MCELFTYFCKKIPINGIILFIQTDLQMRNAHKHKRWDLSHEPITAEHNKSYPIITRWMHCLLSRDIPPFILSYPPLKLEMSPVYISEILDISSLSVRWLIHPSINSSVCSSIHLNVLIWFHSVFSEKVIDSRSVMSHTDLSALWVNGCLH